MNGGRCVAKRTGVADSQTQSAIKVWCECRFAYYGSFCQEGLTFRFFIPPQATGGGDYYVYKCKKNLFYNNV